MQGRRASGTRWSMLGWAAATFAAALIWGAAGTSAAGVAAGARASDSTPPTAAASEPYAYLRTRGTYLDTTVYGGRAWSVYQPEIVEQWVGADGSGRQRTRSLAPRWAGAGDRRAWEEAGRPTFLAHGFASHVGDEMFPPGTFPKQLYRPDALAAMPLEPSALAGWLVSSADAPYSGGGNGFPSSVRVLELISGLLRNPIATAVQRTALVEALALVPGIESLGEAKDEVGRRGTALGAHSDNSGAPEVYSLIFDPATSEPLASETVRLSPPPALKSIEDDGPVLVSSTAYLSEGATASRRARPHRSRRR